MKIAFRSIYAVASDSLIAGNPFAMTPDALDQQEIPEGAFCTSIATY